MYRGVLGKHHSQINALFVSNAWFIFIYKTQTEVIESLDVKPVWFLSQNKTFVSNMSLRYESSVCLFVCLFVLTNNPEKEESKTREEGLLHNKSVGEPAKY